MIQKRKRWSSNLRIKRNLKNITFLNGQDYKPWCQGRYSWVISYFFETQDLIKIRIVVTFERKKEWYVEGLQVTGKALLFDLGVP